MLGLIRKYWGKYRAIKLERAEEIIRGLKIRYHTFRILLINNDRALKILNEIDLRLKRKNRFWQDLGNETDELIGISYELVDGLNRLSDNKYIQLYKLHKMLSESIRKELPEISRKSGEALCANVSETLPPLEFRVYD